MRYFKWKVDALSVAQDQLDSGKTEVLSTLSQQGTSHIYGQYFVYVKEIDPTFNYRIIEKFVDITPRDIHVRIWHDLDFKYAYMHVLRHVRKLGNITLGSVTD